MVELKALETTKDSWGPQTILLMLVEPLKNTLRGPETRDTLENLRHLST